jgi:hypothetical protein
MNLKLNVLPAAQRALWPSLSAIPSAFTLYGGTAIALQLGHRESVDFDFFARCDFDPQQLLESLPLLAQAEVVALAKNTLTVRLNAQFNGELNFGHAPVLLSFFGVPKLPALRPAHRLLAPCLALGDLLELAGMKAMVVQKRAEAKDYRDIHALIYQAKIDLPTHLAAALSLYPPHYAPEQTLKSLCYFADGNLSTLESAIRRDLAKAVRSVDLQNLPELLILANETIVPSSPQESTFGEHGSKHLRSYPPAKIASLNEERRICESTFGEHGSKHLRSYPPAKIASLNEERRICESIFPASPQESTGK